jgi:hypothetical protein
MPGYDPGHPLVAGLAGWWQAKNGPLATDLVHGNNGVMQGSGTVAITDLAATGLKAWDLDSTLQQYWSAPGEQHNLSGSAMTLAAWARRDGAYGNSQYPILGGHATDMRGYSISIEQNGIGTSWNAYGLLGNNGTGWRQVVHGGTLSTVGTWCHLCLTYNGTSLYLYRNGVQVASGTSAGTFSATAAGVPYWNGAIGDLAVWSGRALSAS